MADRSGARREEVICNEGSLMNTKAWVEVVRIVRRTRGVGDGGGRGGGGTVWRTGHGGGVVTGVDDDVGGDGVGGGDRGERIERKEIVDDNSDK